MYSTPLAKYAKETNIFMSRVVIYRSSRQKSQPLSRSHMIQITFRVLLTFPQTTDSETVTVESRRSQQEKLTSQKYLKIYVAEVKFFKYPGLFIVSKR